MGDPDALFHVASVYDAGTERVENENEDLKLITFRLYRLAADQGHSEAQYKMAEMHETGHDAVVDRNLIEALKLYTQAAENGNLRAQIKLGKIYTYGYGKKVKQNDFKALKWFEKACINGNIGYLTTESHKELVCEARYQLGLLLMRTGDKTNAVLQFRAAVDQCGHLDAMFQLGLCHDQGKGVSRNDAEAVRFYTLASDQGQPDAMFFLGAMHEYGRVDGAKDLIKAFQLYHEAAQRGNADAQFKMEVERDRAAQNDPDAVKLMAEIDNKPIKKVYKIKPQSQGPNFPALND